MNNPKTTLKGSAAKKAPAATETTNASPTVATPTPTPAPAPAQVAPKAAKTPKPAAAAKKAAAAPPKAAALAPAAATKLKHKLVRDSFTIPKTEYAVLEELKTRAANLKRPVKKSELLRAGIVLLNALKNPAFLAALNAVPSLKTGRPKGASAAAADKAAE